MKTQKSSLRLDTVKNESGLEITCGFTKTPFGSAYIGLAAGKLCFLGFGQESQRTHLIEELARNWPKAALIEADAPLQLPYPNSPLLVRGTPLQIKVWSTLADIPDGVTITYQQLAQQVGHPRAVRAVASAVGANPISWLLPCHRVLRKDGGLGGYRWGLEIKERLLRADGCS